jgi:hypothetical protein
MWITVWEKGRERGEILFPVARDVIFAIGQEQMKSISGPRSQTILLSVLFFHPSFFISVFISSE